MPNTSAGEVTLRRTSGGNVAWLRFASDHPANVITAELLERFLEAVDALEADPPRVLVVSGRDDVFSGGADLGSLRAMSDDAYRAYIAAEYRLFRRVDLLPFVTIAVVAGPCIGNAAELALACDLRLAAESARIGFPEPRVGFVAPAQRLTRFVGIGRAKELLYTGAVLRAAQAQAEGLVTAVAADDRLAHATEEMVATYASYAPVALRLTKEGVGRAYGVSDDHDEAERSAAFATFKTDDFREGSAAALERRQANFNGR